MPKPIPASKIPVIAEHELTVKANREKESMAMNLEFELVLCPLV